MAKSKGSKARQNAASKPASQPSHLNASDDEASFDVQMGEDVSEPEKDEDEEELERLVFGDSDAFHDGLKGFAAQDEVEDESVDDEYGATGLEGLDNADLFFMDGNDEEGGENTMALATVDSDDDDTLKSKLPAAWEDSDDERMMVSLASAPRLRKLRKTEAEDVVNGKEYGRRLRKQFELLNPKPEWALNAMQQPARKKRRLSKKGGDDEDDFSDEEMDMDDDIPSVAPLSRLLQDADSLVRASGPGQGKKRKLRPEVIDIQRTPDIGGVQPSAITSLSFHPTLPLLLSSGPSSTLYLHQLSPSPPSPTPNPLLTSLHIRGAALTTTAFHPTSSQIFLSARRRYFHVWNLQTGRVEKVARVYGQQHEQRSMERFKLSPDGRYMALLGSARKGGGVINILSASTLQWACQVRVESRGGIADFAWWRDGNGLCIVGKSGEVTEWSVETETVVARWVDEGAVGSTTVALGGVHELTKSPIGRDRWVVVGSSSGIVNIYDRRAWLASASSSSTTAAPTGTKLLTSSTKSSTPATAASQPIPTHPTPTKTLDHLTTPTSHLAFSPDGQVLAMASKWKRDAMRLVHLPTCTVFKNWPTSKTPLGTITGVAFCGGEIAGGEVHSVVAVANEQGKIRVWEIR